MVYTRYMANRFSYIRDWSRRDRRRLFTLVGALVLAFAGLSVVVALIPAGTFDIAFSENIQRYDHPVFDKLMKFTSWFGYGWQTAVTVFSTAAIFFLTKQHREGWYTILTALCLVPVFALKFAFGRERPATVLFDLVTNTQYQSFPSGHVALYVCFFGFIAFLMNRMEHYPNWLRWGVGGFCIAIILLVPFSRVYLGAHWFTDVLGGFIVGLLCLLVLCLSYIRTLYGEVEV